MARVSPIWAIARFITRSNMSRSERMKKIHSVVVYSSFSSENSPKPLRN